MDLVRCECRIRQQGDEVVFPAEAVATLSRRRCDYSHTTVLHIGLAAIPLNGAQ